MKSFNIKKCVLSLIIILPLNTTPTHTASWWYDSLANMFSSAANVLKSVKREHVAIGVGIATGVYGLYYAYNKYRSCPEVAAWQKLPFKWGCYTYQGDRGCMEDYHVAKKIDGNRSFFGIFDGHGIHGGHLVAEATANGDQATKVKPLWRLVSQELNKESSKADVFDKAFQNMDNQFPEFEKCDNGHFVTDADNRKKYHRAGTTATVVLIEQPFDENKSASIDVAWVGDSRAIIITDNGEIIETYDHKASDEKEKTRVINMGGDVSYGGDRSLIGGWRVNKRLAVTRAIGDKFVKSCGQGIIACPDTMSLRYNECRWLVIASDGVWDHLSNNDVYEILKNKDIAANDSSYVCFKKNLDKEEKVSTSEGFASMINVAKCLVDEAYHKCEESYGKGISDNISALVLRFNQ